MDFTGRIVLITGAANGIGRATATSFAQAGAKLVLVDRDAQAGAQAAAELSAAGTDARFFAADVSKSAEVEAFVHATVTAHGRIDCFFNNAGIEGGFKPIPSYDEDEFDRVIAVNLKGVFLGLKHVLPVMAAQHAGAIVNTASVAGLIGAPGMSAYIASKHGVLGLTKTASGEFARQGVRINAICPGSVDTRMIHSIEEMVNPADPAAAQRLNAENTPTGRYTRPDEIAGLVMYLCSDIAANITGAHFVIDGGRGAASGAFKK